MAYKRKRSWGNGFIAKRRKVFTRRRYTTRPASYKQHVRNYKRVSHRGLGRNKMIRRRKVGWGNELMSRILKIKNLTETTIQWDYYMPDHSTSQPVRLQVGHTNWILNPTHLTVKEHIFDSYVTKKLLKFTYKYTNWRVMLNTRQTAPTQVTTVGSAPAATTCSTKVLEKWPLFFWRMGSENQAVAPPAGAEARFTQKMITPTSSIGGKVPVNSARMNGFTGSYNQLYTTFGNSDTYLKAFGNNGSDANGGAMSDGNMYVPDIYVMPHDPFPESWLILFNGTASANISIMCDVICYTTWALRKCDAR